MQNVNKYTIVVEYPDTEDLTIIESPSLALLVVKLHELIAEAIPGTDIEVQEAGREVVAFTRTEDGSVELWDLDIEKRPDLDLDTPAA